MADFMKMLQQAQQMQGKMQQMQEDLARRTITGSAGGGMVTVEGDGTGQLKRIKIDPSVVNPADTEMLEDLVLVALQDAQQKAAEALKEETAKITGGMNLPFKLPF